MFTAIYITDLASFRIVYTSSVVSAMNCSLQFILNSINCSYTSYIICLLHAQYIILLPC
jgi:hypothetical protein